MSEGKVRRLLVVSETGQLEGILSMDDLVRDAKSGAAKMGSILSYGDVVVTLRAICARDIHPYAGAAAA
jgi:CBS domain-containing protein